MVHHFKYFGGPSRTIPLPQVATFEKEGGERIKKEFDFLRSGLVFVLAPLNMKAPEYKVFGLVVSGDICHNYSNRFGASRTPFSRN